MANRNKLKPMPDRHASRHHDRFIGDVHLTGAYLGSG